MKAASGVDVRSDSPGRRVADVTLTPQGQAQFSNLAGGDVGVARLSYDDA